MNPEVAAEIEAQARQARESGLVPAGFEDELNRRFEEAAVASLAAAGSGQADGASAHANRSVAGLAGPAALVQRARKAKANVRRRFGPLLRRVERRAAIGVTRMGEQASIQLHVTADHLERSTARSSLAACLLRAVRPSEPVAARAGMPRPAIEGPVLEWAVDRLRTAVPGEGRETPGLVLHTECGDGRVVEVLAARGFLVRGADPNWATRPNGDTAIVAAGALEFLGTTIGETFDGLLLTGIVDRLRPGAAQVLAQLAARCLTPGGVVVLVSERPEVAAGVDPVAADLAPGRSLHPVTWCHLLARYGLIELAVYEADTNEPDVFAVSAQRPLSSLLDRRGRR
jgi:hypothetical protein